MIRFSQLLTALPASAPVQRLDASHADPTVGGIGYDSQALFDVVKTVEQHINKALTGEQAATGFTSFVRFATDFEVDNQTVSTPNLLLENDVTRVGGGGSFNFANELDYNLSSLITGAIAKTLGGRANADGIAQLAVPLRSSPKTRKTSPSPAMETRIASQSGRR